MKTLLLFSKFQNSKQKKEIEKKVRYYYRNVDDTLASHMHTLLEATALNEIDTRET